MSEPTPPSAPSRSGELTPAIAKIEANLPADGCSYVVTIDDADYAPDATSFAVLREGAVKNGATVAIRYRSTGRTGQVECGFNTHRDLPEIAFTLDAFPVEPGSGTGG